jgi:mannosidase alpha-like ER degradation enhancer 1
MFHHGYTGYMEHAYPADELRPVTCAPLWRDPDATNIGVNDIHANVSMTLVDSLSALLLVLPDEWPAAVERVATTVSFDQDVKVQASI